MATPEEKAVSLKNEGNKAFTAHDWPAAIDFYTQAIKLNDKEPTYYANRAQVSTPRDELPPFAILARGLTRLASARLGQH